MSGPSSYLVIFDFLPLRVVEKAESGVTLGGARGTYILNRSGTSGWSLAGLASKITSLTCLIAYQKPNRLCTFRLRKWSSGIPGKPGGPTEYRKDLLFGVIEVCG